MEPKGSSPYSQVPAICPYSEPTIQSPPPPTSRRSILILSSHLRETTLFFIFREFPGSNHDAETECPEAFLSFRYVFSAQVAIRRPVSAKARVPSKPSPCWICVAESDTVTCLSQGTSVFPYQYHSIGAPYSYFIYLAST